MQAIVFSGSYFYACASVVRCLLSCIAGAAVLSGGLCTSAGAAAPSAAELADVIPAPARVVSRKGVFAIRGGTLIFVPRDSGVQRVAHYFSELLQQTRGTHLEVVASSGAAAPARAIAFRLDPRRAASNPESYAIDVSPRQIVVSAGDPRGLLYGAVTLWQLCTSNIARANVIEVPALRIDDSPRLPWRGLMLDSARHYQSPEFILQFIDWMALHKLNVLQWHLTDDQGWRLEIKKYPRLTEVGAWRVPAGAAAAADIDPSTGHPRSYGGFYSQDTVRRVVAHAAERNVTIVPEIDMPGHASAAIVAYPQLGVTDRPPQAVPSDWGVYPNLYNVEDSTFAFLQDVLDEVMDLFPSVYLHAGGDEAVKDQWKASPRVQARMRELHVADEPALQSYFVQRIEKYMNAHGRRLIGWDEILEGGIAQDATVMSWHGIDGAVAAVAAGHDTVLSPAPILYFDNSQGRGANEPPGRGHVVSLQEVYGFEPMPTAIAASQRSHVLGLQANLWTEHLRTEDRVAYMTFPRAAAVAEVGWSLPERRNWDSFARRLPHEFARYRAVGLHYSDDILRSAVDLYEPGTFEKRRSQELRTCTDKLVLNLEDDAPVRGPRAVFLIDIMNPCWMLESVDLSRVATLQVAVGQVPFNFQIGKDRDAIQLLPPQTPRGELEVRLDNCGGERIAVLPLAPAVGNDAVTTLPAAPLAAPAGRHDLCFRFTQKALDPLWALDWVQLLE